jgi:hypothetical protein
LTNQNQGWDRGDDCETGNSKRADLENGNYERAPRTISMDHFSVGNFHSYAGTVPQTEPASTYIKARLLT